MAAPLIVGAARVAGSKIVKKSTKRQAQRKAMRTSTWRQREVDNLPNRDSSSLFNQEKYGPRPLEQRKVEKDYPEYVKNFLMTPEEIQSDYSSTTTKNLTTQRKQNIVIRTARGFARRLFVGRIVIPITFLLWQFGLFFWIMSLFGAAMGAFGSVLTEYIPFLDLFIDPSIPGYILFAVGWIISSGIAIVSMATSYYAMNKIKPLTFMSTFTFVISLALSIGPFSGGLLPWATIWSGATYITR